VNRSNLWSEEKTPPGREPAAHRGGKGTPLERMKDCLKRLFQSESDSREGGNGRAQKKLGGFAGGGSVEISPA